MFGLAEDLPTPADYDGDGIADVSVFRPSTATWYRRNSSDGSFYAIQFGLSEDKPTIGDFDGDGNRILRSSGRRMVHGTSSTARTTRCTAASSDLDRTSSSTRTTTATARPILLFSGRLTASGTSPTARTVRSRIASSDSPTIYRHPVILTATAKLISRSSAHLTVHGTEGTARTVRSLPFNLAPAATSRRRLLLDISLCLREAVVRNIFRHPIPPKASSSGTLANLRSCRLACILQNVQEPSPYYGPSTRRLPFEGCRPDKR